MTWTARQKELLAAMGIAHWAPDVAGPATASAPALAVVPVPTHMASELTASQAPVSVSRASEPPITSPQETASAPPASPAPRQTLSSGDPQDWPSQHMPGEAAHGPWVVVVDAPSSAAWTQGEILDEDEVVLLGKILAAVGGPACTVVPAVRAPTPGDRLPQAQEVDRDAAALALHLQSLQAKAVVVLGRGAARSLLGDLKDLGPLRERLHDLRGTPLMVSYPLRFLLRQPQQKANAWKDWQLIWRALAP